MLDGREIVGPDGGADEEEDGERHRHNTVLQYTSIDVVTSIIHVCIYILRYYPGDLYDDSLDPMIRAYSPR